MNKTETIKFIKQQIKKATSQEEKQSLIHNLEIIKQSKGW